MKREFSGSCGVWRECPRSQLEKLIKIIKEVSGAKRARAYCAQKLLDILEEPAQLFGLLEILHHRGAGWKHGACWPA